MRFSAGQRLGVYEIVAPAGAGGMGEVYRARDTRLDRTVAIKVLNAALGVSPEIVQRFEREARTISQLQHPHICTLYDVGRFDGADYLVVEFLEGETLADRLARGPLPIDQVLKVAIQIADALHHAHRAGIVHRDLKPGNVMLTKSGAKLLDFGLAKPYIAGATAGGGTAPLLSAAATMTGPSPSPLTTSGSVIGTIQYMSPEQLQGLEADARSDIFAFGAMLYEMATGQRAFQGKSQIKVASAILEDEPIPLTSAAPAAPQALDRLVRACLAKDPNDRFQSAHDVGLDLAWIGEPSAAASASGLAASRMRRARAWIAAGTCALVAIGALAFALTRLAATPTPRVIRASLALPDHVTFPGATPFFALSPDGTKVAFQGVTEDGESAIYLRDLDSVTWRPLKGTDGVGHIFWSPDSRSLAFFAEGKLKRVDAAGGPVETIAPAPNGRGGSWNTDDLIIFSPDTRGPISKISADGGRTTPLTPITKLSAGEDAHRYPVFLPDGRHFLYSAVPSGKVMIGTVDGAGGTILVDSPCQAEFAEPGWLLFVKDDNLLVQRFDPTRLRFEGAAVPVAEPILMAVNPTANRAAFTVSKTGMLVYATGSVTQRLVYADRSAKIVTPSAVREAPYAGARFSPDGRYLAYSLTGATLHDIFIHDVARDVVTRLTSRDTENTSVAVVWSPDGSQIAFARRSADRRQVGIYLKGANGVGDDRLLVQGNFVPLDWSSDNKFLLYGAVSQMDPQLGGGGEIWALPLTGDRKPFQIVSSGSSAGRLSSDVRWLAYMSNRSGTTQIFVSSFPDRRKEWPVTSGNAGGQYPVWSGDARQLYYVTRTGQIMVVDVAERQGGLEFGPPRPLFGSAKLDVGVGLGRFDVTRDGGRFALFTRQTHLAPVTLMTNWTEALKR